MIEFLKLTEDSYVLYKNGMRITPIPLTKQELYDKIIELDLSRFEQGFIDNFFGGDKNGKAKAEKKAV